MEVEDLLLDSIQDAIDGDVDFEVVADYYELLLRLHHSRYLRPRIPMPFSTDLRDRVLSGYNDEQFRNILRVTPGQFNILVGIIRDNIQFQADNPFIPQAPVEVQLKVALFRLGTKGVSIKKVAWVFGVSDGSVSVYTWRCIHALVSLEREYICWPNRERKQEVSAWFDEHKYFPDIIGVIDGITFPFQSAPEYETVAWITRKCDYAMGATGVCDHQGIFTYFSTGYIGSMHDSVAYKNTDLHMDQEAYFQGRQRLMADAAYGISPTIMPRYKNATGDQLTFNYLHGSARSKIENAFGMLKMKFQSLQNLPVPVKNAEDIDKTADWVLACVVLHNFIRMNAHYLDHLEERLYFPAEDLVDDDNPEVAAARGNERQLGVQRRDEVKEYVLARYRHR